MATEILNSNKYGSATEADVTEFERLIKARLPEDYRKFLLEHNGGKTNPSFFSKGEGEDQVFGYLDGFFGLVKEPKNDSLYWYFDCYRGWIYPQILSS